MKPQLIVNADDFGFTPDVNAGIIQAHQHGILTATTLMANGDAFAEAVALAAANPTLDIGCHLVLIGGRSLLPSRHLFPTSLPALLTTLHQLDPTAEFRAQIEHLLAHNIRPTHLDTHKHTHLHPRVLSAVCTIAREYNIPWVRVPIDSPQIAAPAPPSRRWLTRALQPRATTIRRRIKQQGLRHTDHFTGFQITGHFGPAELLTVLTSLPLGLTELMVHPGLLTKALQSAPTRLKASRATELSAVTSPAIRALNTYELTSYFRQPA